MEKELTRNATVDESLPMHSEGRGGSAGCVAAGRAATGGTASLPDSLLGDAGVACSRYNLYPNSRSQNTPSQAYHGNRTPESDTSETLLTSRCKLGQLRRYFSSSSMTTTPKVVVVGAGPVGALAALYAAQRGYDVSVYELRNGKEFGPFFFGAISNSTWRADLRDPSTVPLNFTRSINLALSERGIHAMRHADRDELVPEVLSMTIPMRGRMVHTRGGRHNAPTALPQDYDVHGRVRLPKARVTLALPTGAPG